MPVVLQAPAQEPEGGNEPPASAGGGPAWLLKRANTFGETRLLNEPRPLASQPAYFAVRRGCLIMGSMPGSACRDGAASCMLQLLLLPALLCSHLRACRPLSDNRHWPPLPARWRSNVAGCQATQ